MQFFSLSLGSCYCPKMVVSGSIQIHAWRIPRDEVSDQGLPNARHGSKKIRAQLRKHGHMMVALDFGGLASSFQQLLVSSESEVEDPERWNGQCQEKNQTRTLHTFQVGSIHSGHWPTANERQLPTNPGDMAFVNGNCGRGMTDILTGRANI